jgi:leader peptidase (prepilin peptidase)/N-methyltransferase
MEIVPSFPPDILPESLLIVLIALLGASFGSYVTMASYRLPRGIDTVRKRSHCPACHATLGWRDLLPLFSWLAYRGRCSHCGVKIPVRYPLIELAQAGLFLLIYFLYGLNITAFLLMALSVVLMILVVADLEHYLLPDKAQFWLLPLGILWSWHLGREWTEIASALAIGAGIGCFLYFGYSRLRGKEMLGFGDVKFLALAGLYLNMQDFPPFFLLAGLLGIATALVWRIAGKGAVFPFGPALICALLLKLLYPEIYDGFWQIAGISRYDG